MSICTLGSKLYVSHELSRVCVLQEMLRSCQGRAGFCSVLTDIIENKSGGVQDEGARWLAAVYFKNSIDRFWRQRRNAPCIGEDEKSVLRTRLLKLVHEFNQKVAIQLAVLIAKVRTLPRQWRATEAHREYLLLVMALQATA